MPKRKFVEVGVFQRGVGHFVRNFQTEDGVAHQPLLVSDYLSDCPFLWYQNVRSALFGFVAKHACDIRTDRRTDGQNYDFQDRSSIAASHGNDSTCVICRFVHRVSKNCAKLFLPERRQISTNFDNFWQKDGKEARII